MNMKKIKAAVLEEVGQPLVIKELEVPDLLEGQVLVQVHYSGVCRSQLMEVRGERGSDKWLPHLLGHEGSGTVIEVGNGVTKVKTGDKVILTWIKCRGIDSIGAKYRCGNQIINSGLVTTFSNYTVVSESRLVLKPDNLEMDVAVLFGCALATGAGMVMNEIKPSINDWVAVLGLGGIGLSALITLKSLGVKNIVAIDKSDVKLALAQNLGAKYLINSNNSEAKDYIFSITNGRGVDICFESAGSVSTIELGFSLISPQKGRLLFASHPPSSDLITLSPHELISGKKISGSWGGNTEPDTDLATFYDIFQKSKINLSQLISKSYSLEEINDALYDLELGSVFRPLIKMSH